MTRKSKKEINKWIEQRKFDLRKSKTKFIENNINDWIEILDYKISELNYFQKFLNKKIIL